jgi:hypothetical protein
MTLLLITSLIISTALFGCNNPSVKKVEIKKPSINIESTRMKAKEALLFCKTKKFNTEFCVLIDMSLHSGVKRFIVWDFKKNKISNRFLVGHGCGNNPWNNDYSKDNPKFSNIDGSHCSSLGKYKIGKRAHSDWGVNIKYFLHGLESTNSNAYKRFIVFHSWEVVSDVEVYPNGTPEGWGCPTISNKSFKIIDSQLQSSSKPVLMWIYK